MSHYAVVTGADHGLGLALTAALARRGYHVLAGHLYSGEEQLAMLAQAEPLVETILLNITDDASIEAFARWAAQRTDHIDLLVNNAGVLGDIERTIAEPLSRSDILRVIDVNAVGTLMVTNALWSLLSAGDAATVLNISSEAGSIADCERRGWFGYCMSKAANNMQGALVHNSLRPLGGRVIQLHPGHMATWMRGHLDTTAPLTPEISADSILRTVLDMELPVRDRPLFIDYTGKEMAW